MQEREGHRARARKTGGKQVKFIVPIVATIEAVSPVEAELHAERVGKLLTQAVVKMALQSNGVRLIEAKVGKPTEKK